MDVDPENHNSNQQNYENVPKPIPSYPTFNAENRTQEQIGNKKPLHLLLSVFALSVLMVLLFIIVGYKIYSDASSSQSKKADEVTRSNNQPDSGSATLPYPTNLGPEEIKFTTNDKKRIKDIQSLSTGLLVFFVNHSNRFPNDASEAASVQNKYLLTDPETKMLYIFVDTTPKRGEVQYKLSANCTKKYRKVESNSSKRIWALAMTLDDGSIICKSNIFSD